MKGVGKTHLFLSKCDISLLRKKRYFFEILERKYNESLRLDWNGVIKRLEKMWPILGPWIRWESRNRVDYL